MSTSVIHISHTKEELMRIELEHLRYYLPKGTEISKLHWNQLKKIEAEINNAPMKFLDRKTHSEVIKKKSCTAFV